MSSDEDEDMYYNPDTPEESTKTSIVPALSKNKYQKAYDDFQKWNKLKGGTPVTQKILLKYFTDLAEKHKPTTLWAYYSMLKATLRTNDNLDITSWSQLLDFLKRKNAGYKPVKATCFTETQLETFMNEAPDTEWLDVKVATIFGLNGVYSGHKLVNIQIEHVKEYENYYWVLMPNAEINQSFTITGSYFAIVKRYAALRPKKTLTNRFFVHYAEGKCTEFPTGQNQFYKMPRRIANYLKLPKPESFSGSSFRLASATEFLARQSARIRPFDVPNTDASNSCSMAETYSEENIDQPVEYSLDYETGLMKTCFNSFTTPPMSVASNGIEHTAEHVCTNNCNYVRCAKEDNEKNVFHAFSIAKSSDYAITELIPTQFPSDPTCRWMVAYSHFNDPVSAHNLKEKFDEITKVIPKNVKVIQKYIRCNSSKLFAAYVVVYGVKCRCQKPIFGPVPVKRDVFRKSNFDPLLEQAPVGFTKPNFDPLSAQPSDSDDLSFSFVDIKQET
ncbi:uncharacterized protein LOC119066538 [Bradysia coprophila]|uniref:uncharacterized protein LOC119066538 n=1 Tax=Bradysia coprophila TaxID=38358 RepID=UPI00187DC2DC|nr:uncharacterized protein LOC119066538 [Bradysia coprophila]